MNCFLPLPKKTLTKLKITPLLTVIGHVVEKNAGCQLITGLGQQIEMRAQGWNSFKNNEG